LSFYTKGNAVERHIAIIGTGLIGTSIGLAATTAGYTVDAWDPAVDNLTTAVRIGAVNHAAKSLGEAVQHAALTIVATPPELVADTLRSVLAFAKHDAIVTDVTSTKVPLMQLANADPRYVPGHPMAGSERHGAIHARADLFHGAVWPICPSENTSDDVIHSVEAFIHAIGGMPMRLDAAVHDASIAITSHLPHIAAYAMYAMARQADLVTGLPVFELAAGGFHSATRVAASSPEVWTRILTSNRAAVVQTLDGYLDHLLAVKQALADQDDATLANLLHAGMRHPDNVVRYPSA
jgi:prephenate dehydrogenase